jgi:hypothetical protein
MKKITFLATVLLTLSWVSMASANSYTFATASGATESGGNAVDASATFTTSADTITISLANLIVNPTTAAQNVSDVYFTLGGTGSSATSGTLSSSGGNLVNVAADGTTSSGGVASSTGWVLSYSSSTGFHLDGLNGAANTPAYTIIGAPNGSGVYSAANGSIAGNGPHNPFLNQLATFSLSIAGLTADSTVTSATFSFGTTSGDNVGTTTNKTSVPDNGATIVLLGASLVGIGLFRRAQLKLSPAV